MAFTNNWQKIPRIAQHKFPNDPIVYISPSFSQLEALTYQVSRQVLTKDDCFDVIVTLAKGGWPMTRSLVDFTGIREIASIGVKFYSGINQKLLKPEVYQDLPIAVSGKKILLFDDVADSGGSLLFVKELLKKRKAKLIRTATLFYKPHSIVKPDFFATTTKAWILFPFEKCEMGKLLCQKWQNQGVLPKEISSRCKKLRVI